MTALKWIVRACFLISGIACLLVMAVIVLRGVSFALAHPELTRTQLFLKQGNEYALSLVAAFCGAVLLRFYERTKE